MATCGKVLLDLTWLLELLVVVVLKLNNNKKEAEPLLVVVRGRVGKDEALELARRWDEFK